VKRFKDESTPDLFDDPSGRGDGWRQKGGKPKEFDKTLARRLGMTVEEYRQDFKMKHARSVRWHKRFSARVARENGLA